MLREEALHTHSQSHTCLFLSKPTDRQTGGDCPALFPYVPTTAVDSLAKNSLQSVQAGSIPSVSKTNNKMLFFSN